MCIRQLRPVHGLTLVQQARDPRFSDLSGTFDAQRFAAQYGFLADMHQSEHASLRENLQRARKLLASSPRDLRAERAAEVTRLEAALRRTESTVAKDRRERVEREALERFKKAEREKRKQGKGAWYMPNGPCSKLCHRPHGADIRLQLRRRTSSSKHATRRSRLKEAGRRYARQSRRSSGRSAKRRSARDRTLLVLTPAGAAQALRRTIATVARSGTWRTKLAARRSAFGHEAAHQRRFYSTQIDYTPGAR
jgi:hypothetical protein